MYFVKQESNSFLIRGLRMEIQKMISKLKHSIKEAGVLGLKAAKGTNFGTKVELGLNFCSATYY